MTMILKKGVSISKCRAEILIAAITIIEPLYIEFGKPCVVTSGSEKKKHSVKRSGHYRGDALDFRTRFFKTDSEKHLFLEALAKKLGPDFVCVLEKTHLHVHWSPVYGVE